jgi:translation elongation factor EF-1beta
MERSLPSLKIHPCDAEADVSALEREIDELVYARYGLPLEEIKLVEGGAK